MIKTDYEKYDYLIDMDEWNIKNMIRIAGGDPDHKIKKLPEFAKSARDIADPWYTGNFDVTYDDIIAKKLVAILTSQNNVSFEGYLSQKNLTINILKLVFLITYLIL